MKKPFAWSWSALNSFETCPRRHFLTKIAKAFPEKQNPQMLAGQQFHRALELRIEKHKRLPEDMQACESTVRMLEAYAEKGGSLVAERKIGVTEDLKECEYFDRNVWLRVVLDAQLDMGSFSMIIDWKTGKIKEDYDQLALSAAVKFALSPQTEKVTTGYFWFQEQRITSETFVREDAVHIWRDILPRVQSMREAIQENNFPPKQSGLCKAHCPCINCEFNGNYTGGKE